jgi:hypothetical protein
MEDEEIRFLIERLAVGDLIYFSQKSRTGSDDIIHKIKSIENGFIANVGNFDGRDGALNLYEHELENFFVVKPIEIV